MSKITTTEPTQAPLRPLPMRITPMQFDRLQAARDYDGISVQEHVRRALDFYLNALEISVLRSSSEDLKALRAAGRTNPGVTTPPVVADVSADIPQDAGFVGANLNPITKTVKVSTR